MADAMTIARHVSELPGDWHGAGTVPADVLYALARHLDGGVRRSLETGTGRTTLLFSHVSDHHTVFTVDDADEGDSLGQVRRSPLARIETLQFVLGPTQRTLMCHDFDEPIDVAYLDGPHGYPFPELEYWAIYPHLAEGGLLIIDDVHIPTVGNMFRFLRDDAMWELLEVVRNTAFFRRTGAPMVRPDEDGWWKQGHNKRFTFGHLSVAKRVVAHAKEAAPEAVKRTHARMRAR